MKLDNLTSTGISVPYSTTTNVSGGGGALQTAINAANPNTRLLIVDSLNYDPVTISGCSNLTIEPMVGQFPTMQRAAPGSFPGTVPGWTMMIGGAVAGLAIRGIAFLGNGNRNSLSQSSDGMIVARNDGAETPLTSLQDLIIEDCSFTETSASPLNGTPGIQLASNSDGTSHNNVWIHRCFFDTNAAGSSTTGANYGACTVAGFGNVYIQNCAIVRTDSLVSRANSNMRGYVYKNLNTVIENCLAWDLGTGGSNEAFKHINTTANNFGTAVGDDILRNCVAYNCKRGYRMEESGATMTVLSSVYHVDTTGICNIALRRTNPANLTVRNCVILGAGDGQAFEDASIVEDYNDVFGFTTLGKTLDSTDLTVTTAFESVPNKDWVALACALQTGASDSGLIGVRYSGTGEQVFWIS